MLIFFYFLKNMPTAPQHPPSAGMAPHSDDVNTVLARPALGVAVTDGEMAPPMDDVIPVPTAVSAPTAVGDRATDGLIPPPQPGVICLLASNAS